MSLNLTDVFVQFWKAMCPLSLYSKLSDPIQQIEFKHDTNDFVPSLESNAWEFVGFQGKQPWTDFRGVGLFGLQQLLYFGTTFPAQSQEILSYCMQFGQLKCYSYAITGINISYDVMTWFRLRKANLFYFKYLYNDYHGSNGLDAVHLLYCKAFVEFHKIWQSAPPETIMGYGEVHKKFIDRMEVDLKNDDLRPLQEAK